MPVALYNDAGTVLDAVGIRAHNEARIELLAQEMANELGCRVHAKNYDTDPECPGDHLGITVDPRK